MHARIDHLLSLRDAEPVGADVAAHVKSCPSCSAQLQRLQQTRHQLQALPQLDAPPSFEQIQLSLSQATAGTRGRIGQFAAAAALLAIGAVAFMVVRDNSNSPPSITQDLPQTSFDTPRLAELVAQSRHLEDLLQQLPDRPRIERVSTAATIDTIEQRIQWLDFQLSYAPDSALNEDQARRLWRERVELMDSLVKVRYAEGGVSF